MEKEDQLQKIYELIEQFDFDKLAINDKTLVLSIISEEEYKALRLSYLQSKLYFEAEKTEIIADENIYKDLNNKISKHGTGISRLLKYPVPLYKVAAAIAILIGIHIVLNSLHHSKNVGLIAEIKIQDSQKIYKPDTIKVFVHDTLEIIKNIIEKPKMISRPQILANIPEQLNNTYRPYDSGMMKLSDLLTLSKLSKSQNLRKDSTLKTFMVSVN